MRTAFSALALIGLMGCATAPISYQGLVPPGAPDSFTCAVQQLNVLGYTMEDADRDAGFGRARKQRTGAGTAILTGSNYHDVITFSVFEDPSTGTKTLRVTAAQVAETAFGFGAGNETGVAPSEVGKNDATRILDNCGAEEAPAGADGAGE